MIVGEAEVEVHWIEVMEGEVGHSIEVREEEEGVQNLSKGVEVQVESMQAAVVVRETLAPKVSLGVMEVVEVHLVGQHENKNLTFLGLEVEVERHFLQALEEVQSFLVPEKVVVHQISTLPRLARSRRLVSLVAWGEVVDLGWIVMQHES